MLTALMSSALSGAMLCGGLYLLASLRGFRKILFWIHLHQFLEIFDWRAKVSWSLEKPATVVDKTAAFIEVGAVLFACAVGGIRSHYHKPQSTSVVVIVVIIPG